MQSRLFEASDYRIYTYRKRALKEVRLLTFDSVRPQFFLGYTRVDSSFTVVIVSKRKRAVKNVDH